METSQRDTNGVPIQLDSIKGFLSGSISESAIIESAFWDTSQTLDLDCRVLEEVYIPPRREPRRQWFNTDFALVFQEPMPSHEQWRVESVPVHPNTLGADIFAVTGADGKPIRLELLNGESIAADVFSGNIRAIRNVFSEISWLSPYRNIATLPFLRVVQLTTCTAFVVSTRTDIAAMTAGEKRRIPADNARMDFYKSDDGHILIDGVIRL